MSAYVEGGGAAEQSNKDHKNKESTADGALSIPVPGAAKKKSRFIVKTVAKEVCRLYVESC